MAFSLSSLFKSLFSLLPSQSLPSSPSFLSPSSTTLQLPKDPSSFAPLISTWDPKSTSTLTSLASSFAIADDIRAVTCPSLAYANTLFFQSGAYNVVVVVEEDEPEEKLIMRFRRAVFKAGVMQECKRRRFFENSQDKKKRKKREASKRNRKRHPQPKPKVLLQAEEKTPNKKDDDEDDKWELPEGDLPY